MLKKMKKGTPHKGPKGIPSYDDYDAAPDLDLNSLGTVTDLEFFI